MEGPAGLTARDTWGGQARSPGPQLQSMAPLPPTSWQMRPCCFSSSGPLSTGDGALWRDRQADDGHRCVAGGVGAGGLPIGFPPVTCEIWATCAQ